MEFLMLLQTKAALCRLCLFLTLILFVLPASCSAEVQQEVAVRQVLDGDTVILDTGRHLRLFGIDAPELAHDGAPEQYFAKEARLGLRDMLAGKRLLLLRAPDSRDHFGRLLGALQLPNGELVNIVMVRKGLAFCYPHPRQGDWLAVELLAAQREALDTGRGFWPQALDSMRPLGTMVGNRNSLRFFSRGCRDAGNIARRNRVHFQDAGEAFWMGYAPARHCGIWPLVR